MTWTLTSSGAAIVKAGVGANSLIVVSGARLGEWSDQSEGFIVAATNKDWVTDYSSVSADFQNHLDNISSSWIAKQIIAYDMSGYTSRAEAQTLLDVHDDIINDGIKILKESKAKSVQSV